MNGINPPDEHGSAAPEPPAPPVPPVRPEQSEQFEPPVPPVTDPFGAAPPPPAADPFGANSQPPSTGPVVPPPYSSYGSSGQPTSAKPKMNWGFFALGFITPTLVGAIIGAIVGALSSVASAFGALLPIVQFGVFAAAFVLWIHGRNSGDNRMRSFGVGMLWSYAAGLLLVMLLFGSCLLMGLPL